MKIPAKALARGAALAAALVFAAAVPLSAAAAGEASAQDADNRLSLSLCRPDPEDPTVIKHIGFQVTIPAVAATCTEPGLSEGKACSTCGAILIPQSPIPPSGHTWDDGTVTVQPTFTSEGVRTYTCAACGAQITETMPKLTMSTGINDELAAKLTPSQPLTVVDGDGSTVTYEKTSEGTQLVITCAEDNVTLTATLEAISGAERVVFVTPQKRTSFEVGALTSLSADGDTFTLTQSGATAALNLNGWDMSYLLEG